MPNEIPERNRRGPAVKPAPPPASDTARVILERPMSDQDNLDIAPGKTEPTYLLGTGLRPKAEKQ